MIKAKSIALFLMLVFCAQAALANNTFVAYFSHEGIAVVKPTCQKQKKGHPKEKDGFMSSSPKAFLVLTVTCQNAFCADNGVGQTAAFISSTLAYNYFPKPEMLVVLDKLVPPPKNLWS